MELLWHLGRLPALLEPGVELPQLQIWSAATLAFIGRVQSSHWDVLRYCKYGMARSLSLAQTFMAGLVAQHGPKQLRPLRRC